MVDDTGIFSCPGRNGYIHDRDQWILNALRAMNARLFSSHRYPDNLPARQLVGVIPTDCTGARSYDDVRPMSVDLEEAAIDDRFRHAVTS